MKILVHVGSQAILTSVLTISVIVHELFELPCRMFAKNDILDVLLPTTAASFKSYMHKGVN